jgi:hypothetical protein
LLLRLSLDAYLKYFDKCLKLLLLVPRPLPMINLCRRSLTKFH